MDIYQILEKAVELKRLYRV